jgi:hypothetical protein
MTLTTPDNTRKIVTTLLVLVLLSLACAQVVTTVTPTPPPHPPPPGPGVHGDGGECDDCHNTGGGLGKV